MPIPSKQIFPQNLFNRKTKVTIIWYVKLHLHITKKTSFDLLMLLKNAIQKPQLLIGEKAIMLSKGD